MNLEIMIFIARKYKLPSENINNIIEYLEYNEWGIALEELCSVIEQEKIKISHDDYLSIKQLGDSMEMDGELWEVLKP